MIALRPLIRGSRLAGGLIFLGALLRLPFFFVPLTYASDVWRQADTASIAHHFLVNGFRLFYPQIFWGGNGPGYVETEFQLYPFIVAGLYALFGEQLWLGRLVSLAFTVAAWWTFYRLACRLIGDRPALWALAFCVLSPLYIRYSVAFMPEATAMCFYLAALYGFDCWSEHPRARYLWGAALATALAVLVKPTAILLGLIVALVVVHRLGWRVMRRGEVWLAALASLAPVGLWYWHARNLYLTYGNTFGILSGGDSKFGNWSMWLSPMLYRALARLEVQWVFTQGGAVLLAVGLYVAIRQKRAAWLISGFFTLGLYYLIVARYAREEWGIQYHIYAVPFAALGVGMGLDTLAARARQTRYALTLAAVSVIVVAPAGSLYRDMLTYGPDPLVRCGAEVKALVPPDRRLIVSTTSYAIEGGIPNNYQEPTIFFYSQRYGWSLPADWHTPDKVELFRQAGARYFVIYSQELYEASPDLAAYLNANARQIGPGLEAGCGIYQFDS